MEIYKYICTKKNEKNVKGYVKKVNIYIKNYQAIHTAIHPIEALNQTKEEYLKAANI